MSDKPKLPNVGYGQVPAEEEESNQDHELPEIDETDTDDHDQKTPDEVTELLGFDPKELEE